MATAIEAINALRLDLLKLVRGTTFHASATTAISAPDATSDATASTLADALFAAFETHVASACNATTGVGAHISAGTWPSDVPEALAPLTSKVEWLATRMNEHMLDTSLHASVDHANQVNWAGLYPQGGNLVWQKLNRLKARFNAHQAAALNSDVAA